MAGLRCALAPGNGKIGFDVGRHGVRQFALSLRQASFAGGLAGALVPALELVLRRIPRPWLSKTVLLERSLWRAFPLAWGFAFLFGGLAALAGVYFARTKLSRAPTDQRSSRG